jgi:WD40 repeat protein
LAKSEVILWDANNLNEIGRLVGHSDKVWNIVDISSEHHPRLITCSDDKSLKVWDMATKSCEFDLSGHNDGVHFIIELLNGLIASASDDGTIIIWDLSTKSIVRELTNAHSSWISQLIQLKSGLLCSASDDELIKIWDISMSTELEVGNDAHDETKTVTPLVLTLSGHTDVVRTLCVLNNGLICSGSCDMSMKFWEIRSEKGIASTESDADPSTGTGTVTRMGNCVGSILGHTSGVNSIIQLRDGVTIATASGDKTVKLWRCHF